MNEYTYIHTYIHTYRTIHLGTCWPCAVPSPPLQTNKKKSSRSSPLQTYIYAYQGRRLWEKQTNNNNKKVDSRQRRGDEGRGDKGTADKGEETKGEETKGQSLSFDLFFFFARSRPGRGSRPLTCITISYVPLHPCRRTSVRRQVSAGWVLAGLSAPTAQE